MYSDRKQICSCLGRGETGKEGGITKYKETSGGDGYVHYLDCDSGFSGINMLKLTKLYAFNMHNLLMIPQQSYEKNHY